MLDPVEDSQCAAFYTEVGSHTVDVALTVVQGVVSFFSIAGSVLIILSYVAFKSLRTTSRLLIVHVTVANFMVVIPNFVSVFMDYESKFKLPVVIANSTENTTVINVTNITTDSVACSENHLLNHDSHVYCQVCVYQAFVSIIGTLASIFLTICVCIHFFVLVYYQSIKRASQIAYVYYVLAWLIPLGISLWLLFHNWLGFEPTYSTLNCAIRTECVPHHHPYQYSDSLKKSNWNRTIGAIFGIKVWQALALLIIPCLFIAIKLKNKKRRKRYALYSVIGSSAPIRDVERKILLIPVIFVVVCAASFVSDAYFYSHRNNSRVMGDAGITVIHFLTRISDNSQGIINFCLFCVFTREVRSAVVLAIRKMCQSKHETTHLADSINWTTSETGYGVVSSQESNKDDPLSPPTHVY